MKIDFEFETPYGKFADALHLPDDHGLTDDEITAMKQQRVDNWIAIVSAPALFDPLFVGFVPSNLRLTRLLFARAKISNNDVVFDLGCGDGLPLIEAAKLGAKCVGVDLNQDLLDQAEANAKQNQVTLELRNEDMRTTDLSGVTCVYMYVNTPANEEMIARLLALPAGTKVLTQAFEFTGLREVAKIVEGFDTGFVYEVT